MAAGEGEASKGGTPWKTRQLETARNSGQGRNTVNPMIGSGAQQTRGIDDGEIRQGGEKPRSRNMTCSWQQQAETLYRPGDRKGNAGVDVVGFCRWKGDLWKPHERCLVETRQRESGASSSARFQGVRSLQIREDQEHECWLGEPESSNDSIRLGKGPRPVNASTVVSTDLRKEVPESRHPPAVESVGGTESARKPERLLFL